MSQVSRLGSKATTVATTDGMTRVTYHSTVVVAWDNDRIVLNSNGWHTNTTRTRMNQASNQFALGFTVYQRNYDWYVDYKGKTLDFVDGMELSR